MPLRVQAILLKKTRYGERDFIIKTFSRQEGIVSFFIHGNAVRKKSGKIVLEPLSILDIVAEKGKGELWRAREIRNEIIYHGLTDNVHKLSMVIFTNEILLKTLQTTSSESDLFDAILSFLSYLNRQNVGFENAHLVFLSALTRHLGFQPHGRFSEEQPFFNLTEGQFCTDEPIHRHFIAGRDASLLSTLQTCDYDGAEKLVISNIERRALLHTLLDYFKMHIEHFEEVKSKDVLEALFQS